MFKFTIATLFFAGFIAQQSAAQEKFTAPASLNLRNLAIGELVRDRSSWLGYDPPTGELLRFRIVEK